MPRFDYTGRATSGAVRGELDGADASAVAMLLMARGVTPLQIEPSRGQATAAVSGPAAAGDGRTLPALFQPKVQPVDVMLFTRQLHTLLRAGVPILRALAGLQESATNQRFKQVLGQVRSDVRLAVG